MGTLFDADAASGSRGHSHEVTSTAASVGQ